MTGMSSIKIEGIKFNWLVKLVVSHLCFISLVLSKIKLPVLQHNQSIRMLSESRRTSNLLLVYISLLLLLMPPLYIGVGPAHAAEPPVTFASNSVGLSTRAEACPIWAEENSGRSWNTYWLFANPRLGGWSISGDVSYAYGFLPFSCVFSTYKRNIGAAEYTLYDPEDSRSVGSASCVDADGRSWYIDGDNMTCLCQRPQVKTTTGNCVASCPDGQEAIDGVCKSTKNSGPDTPNCPISNPVNVGSGNKFQLQTIWEDTWGLDLKLTYNSQAPIQEYFGRHWLSNWSRSVSSQSDAAVNIEREDGKTLKFFKNVNEWIGDNDVHDHLVELVDSTGVRTGWEYHLSKDQSIETYDVSGQLLSIRKLNGYELFLQYSTGQYNPDDSGDFYVNEDGSFSSVLLEKNRLLEVSDSFGRSITFQYGLSNDVAFAIDAVGNQYGFTYDSVWRRLEAITLPSNDPELTTITYHYEDANFPFGLTGITDERGIRYATYEYYADGRARASYHAGNAQRVDITYNDTDGTRAVTNSKGLASTYSTQTQLGVSLITDISGPGCSTCGSGNTSYNYDPLNNNLLSKTVNGITTQYGNYDTKGQYGYKIEAVGTTEQRRTDYTYDSRYFNRITSITEPSVYSGNSRVTAYTYDAFGNRTSQVINGFKPDGTPVTRTATYQYNGPLNQISQIDGPRTDVTDITTLTYYANNVLEGNNRARLQTIIGPENIALRDNIQYTATGKVLSEDRPNGLAISYTYYSGNDRLETLTETSVGVTTTIRTTRWTYLATGEVATITQADGTAMAITTRLMYDDARRLIGLVDQLGNHIDYTLDTEDNRINEEVFDVNSVLLTSVQQTFDIYNRLNTRTLVDEIIDYSFQPDGTLFSSVNAKNVTTGFQYDALKRLTSVTGDVGGVNAATQDTLTSYIYDVADRLTAVVSPNNSSTTYSYDDLGNLLSEDSPDRGVRAYTYDAASNVKTVTDARPITVAYTYDALNRVTEINYPGTDEDITMSYDNVVGCNNGIGNLCQVIDPSGTTTYSYDSFGNQASQAHTELGFTYQTLYSYDLLNRPTQTITPTGRSINYNYDALGRVINISATVNGATKAIISNVSYRGDGLLTRKDYGNGFTEQRLYDSKGRLSTQTLPVRNSGGQP